MAGAEADDADIQLPRLVKIRQQQHHAGCWWHSCLGRRDGEKKNLPPMCQLTWKQKISYSDAYHRDDAFSWRERSSIFMINSALWCYLLPRLGVALPVWDLIENHDAIQCDVTKCSSANTQVKRHPPVFQKNLLRDLRAEKNMLSFQAWGARKKKRQHKNAQIWARGVGSRAGHPRRVFASILIFIQSFLRADRWLLLGGKKKKTWLWVQLRREAVIFWFLSEDWNEISLHDSYLGGDSSSRLI